MGELFLSTFITLFVVIDPIGCAPIFGGLTRGASQREASATAIRATTIAGAILLLFALCGAKLLAALVIALELVFEKRTERDPDRAEEVLHASPPVNDVSVFPMAMPMIAGPGSIATVMLLGARSNGMGELAAVLGALLLVLALMLAALVAARPIMRLLGTRVEAAMTRLLGVLLAALAVQYVIDGVKGVLLPGH